MVRRRAVGYSARVLVGSRILQARPITRPAKLERALAVSPAALRESTSPSLAWVAVVYTDWQSAQAPDPDAVIEAATAMNECRGVLFDTFDKSRGTEIDDTWKARIALVRASGRFVALAGSLDAGAIARLGRLEADIFAVRGAACRGGNRHAAIDPERVARLVREASASMAAPSVKGGVLTSS